MKKLLIGSSIAMALVLLVILALGANVMSQPQDKTLTGKVVCLYCYLTQDAMGPKHAACAGRCFSNGMPPGLKVGDRVYLLEGEKRVAFNRMMEPYAEKNVTVTGKVFQKDGMSMVEVGKVEKAPGT